MCKKNFTFPLEPMSAVRAQNIWPMGIGLMVGQGELNEPHMHDMLESVPSSKIGLMDKRLKMDSQYFMML